MTTCASLLYSNFKSFKWELEKGLPLELRLTQRQKQRQRLESRESEC